jgi:isochorismatase family protein
MKWPTRGTILTERLSGCSIHDFSRSRVLNKATGGETDVCVLATMLGAIDWGFRVILVTDALCSSADETHNAMMNVYMNRFGEQVEPSLQRRFSKAGKARRGVRPHERRPLSPRADPPSERNMQTPAYRQGLV